MLPNHLLDPALRSFDAISPHPVDWLWPLRIPRARLTLLIGEPGVGKSLLAAELAARVTSAAPWPDNPAQPSCRAAVLLFSPEDSPADTLHPRLVAARADLSRVFIIDGLQPTRITLSVPYKGRTSVPADALFAQSDSSRDSRDSSPADSSATSCSPLILPDHVDLLAQAIRAVQSPALLILDPLHAMISPAAFTSASAAAAVVACLGDIARTYNIAVLAISHPSKSRNARILYRARGSIALIAAARSILLLSHDPSDADRRILAHLKTVYAKPPSPLAFRIDSSPRIRWRTRSASRLSFPADLLDLPPEAHSALIEATDWLAHALSQGPRQAADLIAQSRAAGISIGTLRRAKRLLVIRSIKPVADAGWLWSLPPQSDKQHAHNSERIP